MDCLFCKMAAGIIRPDIVHEDEHMLAFRDIAPQAPVHVLLIPKKHIANLEDAAASDAPLLAHLLLTAQKIARDLGVVSDGYRLVNNCNAHGGQTVYHLHIHLLAGRPMGWPPG